MFSYTSVGRNAACISVRLIGLTEQKNVCRKTETQSNNNKKPAAFVILYSLLALFVFSLQALIHTVSRRGASQEKSILGIFEALSWKHIMIAHGNFYIKNYTNTSPFKRSKQVIQTPSTTRHIRREMKHSP